MIGRHRRAWSIVAAYLMLLAVLARFGPLFFTLENGRNLMVAIAPGIVAALGMTLVILCREIDISIGSQAGLCAVAAGLMARGGLPMPLVALATIALGAGLGAVNGALVAFGRLPSIVATLATFFIARESLAYWRGGEFVRDLPGDFQWFGLGQSAGRWGIVAMAAILAIGTAWGLRNLPIGRAVYATGSDAEAARLAGLRPRRVVFGAFAAMGAASSLYALLTIAQLPTVDPKTGTGLELQTIAAVVVGGVAISGGRGGPIGASLGVILLATIGPALIFLGASATWARAIEGGIILSSVLADSLGGRRPAARRGGPTP